MKFRKLIVILAVATALSACAPVVIVGGAGVAAANVAGSSVDTSTTYSDKVIQMRANDIITNTQALKGNSNVDVVVFNGIVLLMGQVPTQAISESLANQMSMIEGVKVVYNQMTDGDIGNVTQYVGDSWITSKVVSALIANKINTLKYKVVTTDAVVYMMGVVTPEEGQVAAEVASRVSGVKKVVKVYSYVSKPVSPASGNDDTSASDDAIGATSPN